MSSKKPRIVIIDGDARFPLPEKATKHSRPILEFAARMLGADHTGLYWALGVMLQFGEALKNGLSVESIVELNNPTLAQVVSSPDPSLLFAHGPVSYAMGKTSSCLSLRLGSRELVMNWSATPVDARHAFEAWDQRNMANLHVAFRGQQLRDRWIEMAAQIFTSPREFLVANNVIDTFGGTDFAALERSLRLLPNAPAPPKPDFVWPQEIDGPHLAIVDRDQILHIPPRPTQSLGWDIAVLSALHGCRVLDVQTLDWATIDAHALRAAHGLYGSVESIDIGQDGLEIPYGPFTLYLNGASSWVNYKDRPTLTVVSSVGPDVAAQYVRDLHASGANTAKAMFRERVSAWPTLLRLLDHPIDEPLFAKPTLA